MRNKIKHVNIILITTTKLKQKFFTKFFIQKMRTSFHFLRNIHTQKNKNGTLFFF